jgi:hypothetical protein
MVSHDQHGPNGLQDWSRHKKESLLFCHDNSFLTSPPRKDSRETESKHDHGGQKGSLLSLFNIVTTISSFVVASRDDQRVFFWFRHCS